jgi:hypothetical protein
VSNDLETVSSKGSFSFRNDKVLQTQIVDGIFVRLERVGIAVARVYFVNKYHAEVPILGGFRIIDHSNGDIEVVKMFGREEYFLGWADTYSMLFNNMLVLKMINQRLWALQGLSDRTVITIEN